MNGNKEEDSSTTATVTTDEEDYYAFLNVPKNASTEEIRNAYKILSKRFHPDKHTNPQLKLLAERMFNKLKKVYDVLSDPQKRAIYDTLGASGVDTDGWALVERKFKSAQEIKEEYEQLVREKEQRRLQQRTNPKGNITVLIDATDIFEHYDDEDEDEEDEEESLLFWPELEVRSMSISQSIEAPMTAANNAILSGNLNARNGIGSGTVSCALRHIFSPTTWGEAEFSAGQGPIISLKGFRTLTSDVNATCQTYFHITPLGIRPGLNAMLSRQFGKNLVGYLTWKAGADSSISTVAVFENQLFRVNGSVQFGLRHSFVSGSYTHKFKTNDARVKLGLKVGTLGVFFEYGLEGKISQHSILGATMSVGSHTGVTLRLKLDRNNQNYMFPIILSEQILPSSVLYGTLVPLLSFYCIKSFFVDPYMKKKEEEELQHREEENASKLVEKRQEAISYRTLMADTCSRIIARESQTAGLIVKRAIYGNPDHLLQYANESRPIPEVADVFDVTVAVQVMLADNSTITFSDTSKTYLPGFCDCYFGRPKKLYILYRYRNANYEVLLDEKQSAILPFDAHHIRS